MSQLLEIKVPDIGDYQDVPVIEVHIKPGDRVEKEQSLITLESDKATMDVPSSHAGIVKEVKVKVGDSISEGGLVLLLEPSDASVRCIKRTSSSNSSPTGRTCCASAKNSGSSCNTHADPGSGVSPNLNSSPSAR